MVHFEFWLDSGTVVSIWRQRNKHLLLVLFFIFLYCNFLLVLSWVYFGIKGNFDLCILKQTTPQPKIIVQVQTPPPSLSVEKKKTLNYSLLIATSNLYCHSQNNQFINRKWNPRNKKSKPNIPTVCWEPITYLATHDLHWPFEDKTGMLLHIRLGVCPHNQQCQVLRKPTHTSGSIRNLMLLSLL